MVLILLDNAIKHAKSPITISAHLSGNDVEIGVRDSGPGISPDQLKHVFDRFYRADDNANVTGFGLGLSIARSLVEAQGGSIVMASEPGKGTLVKLRFPASFPEG